MNIQTKRIIFIIITAILSFGVFSISTSANSIITQTIENFDQPNQDSWNVDFIGQIGGGSSPYAIDINGNFAYVGVGNYIQILDMTNPYLPLWKGRIHISPNALVASGNYLYVAAWNFGLKVIDVSDSDNPIVVGSFDSPGSALGISISGIYAYLADGDYGLVIIDISNPTQPIIVGSIDTPGTAYDVVVSGSYAYVVDDAYGLRVINISNPFYPFEVGSYNTPGGAVGLAVSGQYAYVADESSGLRIIRISNPSNPIEVGFYDPQYNVWGVATSGVYAYLANEYGGFKVVNISNPYYPYEIGGCDSLSYAKRVAVLGEFAYVTDMFSPFLWVFNISNPYNPIVAGQYDLSRVAYDVAISGNHAYIAYDSAGMGIINITDPSLPVETSIFDTSDAARGIAISGSYVYISDGSDGLRVVDISNPATPFQVGFYDSPGYANDVVVSGNLAYLADGSYGLEVINISDPADPYIINWKDTPGYAIGLAISGNYIYIADSSAGLRIVNISNPYQPIEVGYYDSPGDAKNIAISGNYAYIADGNSGIRVVDITDPADPYEVGYYDTPGLALGIAISSGIAYVADGSSGLQVLSVINPTNPTLVGYYNAGDAASNVTISGDYIYLANMYGGMLILRFNGERYYSISGHIADFSGNPIPGVVVSVSHTYNAISDSFGNYRVDNVIEGKYSVTPSLLGYAFTPLTQSITVPPDSTGVDFNATQIQIERFEVNQALGQQKDGEQYYAAGKATALRVFLNVAIPITQSTQNLTILRDNIPVTVLYPSLRPGTTDEIEFLCPNMIACGNWGPGSYTFDIEMNGIGYQSQTYIFSETKSLRILAVPVQIKVNDEILLPDETWRIAHSFVNKVYPLPLYGLNWFEDPVLDATDLDLNNVFDQLLLRLRLSLKQPKLCGHFDRPPCYDQIIGFIHPVDLQDGSRGWTYLEHTSIVMTDEDMQAILAHEIGHSYGLGDEYGQDETHENMCGVFQCNINPPPPNYCGSNGFWLSCIGNFKCTESIAVPWTGDGTGSTVVSTLDHPFDVAERGPLGNMLSFMGSGERMSNYWITPDIYHQLFIKQLPAEQNSSVNSEIGRVIQANGVIGTDNTIELLPWIAITTTLPTLISGTYTIEALDGFDVVLASQGFEVSFISLSDPPAELDDAPFWVNLSFPIGTKVFQINKGDAILARYEVSDNSPLVNVISPNGGEIWGPFGTENITWTGSDVDGDVIYYTVLYSPNGTDWTTISTNITDTQTSVVLNEIPGGDGARVQVIATDGINTSIDESDAIFTVGKKGPSAYIFSPSASPNIPFSQSFYLHGYAYDLEDGVLGETAFQWYSDKDGYLGMGRLVLVNLSFGNHLITLTVSDSDGNTTSKAIHVFVGSLVFLPISMK